MRTLTAFLCFTFAVLLFSAGESFALSPCPEDQNQRFHNCFGTYTAPDGSKYVGEWRDDKKHGQGTTTFATSGDKYVGEYRDNKKHGQGTYTYGSSSQFAGDKYVGEFRDDKRHGQGTYTFADGSVVEGIFKDGEFQYTRNGSSTVTALSPCPEDQDQRFHNCFGTFTAANGDKYVGEWRDDKKHGQGTYTYADGSVVEGIFKDDEFQYARKGSSTVTALSPCPEDQNQRFHNCFGTFTSANGDKYVGEWRDDKQHGLGTHTNATNGQKYVGEFRNGKPHGHGTYTFADGEKYVGEFKDGNYHGQGTITFANGNKYVGEYRDDKKHGQGTATFADGEVQEGVWENGEFQYARKGSPPVIAENPPSVDPDEVVSASSGTGFAVSSDGHVITNNHVIDGCQRVQIHHKGKSLPATVVTFDPNNDLALLQGDFRPSAVFALSKERPELLQDVYVAGYPFGQRISTSVKVTKGIISSLTGIGNNFSNIQIDAALQPGNSGGPILNDKGNVVGVAVAKLDLAVALEEFGVIPEDTNFGIKTNVVRSLLESNDISLPDPNTKSISKSQLGKMITDGTYYLSCWMTYAQIEMMRSRKVFFPTLD